MSNYILLLFLRMLFFQFLTILVITFKSVTIQILKNLTINTQLGHSGCVAQFSLMHLNALDEIIKQF